MDVINRKFFKLKILEMKRLFTFSLLMVFFGMAFAQVTVKINVIHASLYTPIVGATVTLSDAHDPVIVETDTAGVAVFTMDVPTQDGYYTYTVTAPGYLDYKNEWLYVATTSTEVSSTAYMNKAYSVSFKIKDQSDVNIENAAVQIKTSYPAVDSTRFTDANGEVAFENLVTTGSLTYVVSADGYADSTAQVQITNDSSVNVTVPAIQLKNAYNIAFTVTDGTNPVEGASVTIGDVTNTTDAGGMVTFLKKINGTYSYLITGSGYVDLKGEVTVTDSDASPAVELALGYDVTFKIINGESGEVGLQKDTVTINDIPKITGDSGMLTFGVEAGSNIAFTNKKAGFKSVDVNIEDLQKDTTVQIYMIPDYKITFNVINGIDYTGVEGATVKFGDTEKQTDENGTVIFANVTPSDTMYFYTITGPEGSKFAAQTGEVSLPVSSTSYLWDNNNTTRTIYLVEPYVYIGLGGWFSYFGAATITFDGADYEYDQGLGGNFFYVEPGTYSYTITPADEAMAITSGVVNLTNDGPVNLTIDVVPGKDVEIYTVNSSGEPVVGSSVNLTANFNDFDGTTMNSEMTTDDTGLALFSRFPLGDFYSYTYSVTSEDYNDIVDAAITITADDAFEIVTLTRGVSVTFHVENKGAAIENIPVEMNGTTMNTDTEGNAVFTEIGAGSYAYTVNISGYDEYTGEVEISDSDVTENIEIIVTSVSDVFEGDVRFYPNPTQGILNVTLPRDAKGNIKVSVLNMAGSVIRENHFDASSQQIRLDISDATNGIYYIKLQGENLERAFKIVKH